MKAMKIIYFALFIATIVIFLTYLANLGLIKHEINECEKWKTEAEIYPDYYLLEWQKKQCEYLGISL
jgi:quinol-cytochrome oxidoreductase complex cytochrome b subunit